MTIEAIRLRCIECGDCLLWQGPHTRNRHPSHNAGEFAGKSLRRVVYTHTRPSPLGKKVVSMKCGESLCLNPDHMYLRSKAAISRETARSDSTRMKRSANMAKYAQAHRAKITMDIARQIRRSTDPIKVEAAKWGVHFSLVSKIRTNVAWKDHSNPFAGLL